MGNSRPVNITAINGMAKGIPTGVRADDLLSISEGVIGITNANGQPLGSALMGTGSRIEFSNGTELVVIVFGDTSGNGQVAPADINRVVAHFWGRQHLDGVFFEAADINRNGVIVPGVINRIVGYFWGRIDSLS